MATVSARVFSHHQKKDGTYNVKIVVSHRKVRRYLETCHWVSQRQLDRDLKIKDPILNKIINQTLDDYRQAISLLNFKLEHFTCETLVDYLRNKNEDINFIKFAEDYIRQLIREGREPYSRSFRTVKNSLVDYLKREYVSINDIHSNMLFAYERYLRGERVIKRYNQLGKLVKTKEKGLSDSGLHNHMRDLRTLLMRPALFTTTKI